MLVSGRKDEGTARSGTGGLRGGEGGFLHVLGSVWGILAKVLLCFDAGGWGWKPIVPEQPPTQPCSS